MGERLPTLERLAVDFYVGRLTVQQAVKRLEADGLLQTTGGRETLILGRGTPPLAARPTLPSIRAVLTDITVRLKRIEIVLNQIKKS